ncbi:MAG: zf-HC2 domain-containing protein [Acidobacteriota bacterium]|nr:zf-HC2 domain-containing protein [Acidobacteriota bacterium]
MSDVKTFCSSPEDLAAFVDGAVSPEERARIVAHLDTCEACFETVAAAAAVADELEVEGLATPPQDGSAGEGGSNPGGRSWFWYTSLPLAATALLVALFWTSVAPWSSDGDGEPPNAEDLVAAIAGGSSLPSSLTEAENPWEDKAWETSRGHSRDEMAREFRLGAQLLALRATLKIDDPEVRRERAGTALRALLDPLEETGLMEVTGLTREDLRKDLVDTDNPRAALARLDELEHDLEQSPSSHFYYGRWARAGQLAAMAGESRAFRQPELGGFARRWLDAEDGIWAQEPPGPRTSERLQKIDALTRDEPSPAQLQELEKLFRDILRSDGLG